MFNMNFVTYTLDSAAVGEDSDTLRGVTGAGVSKLDNGRGRRRSLPGLPLQLGRVAVDAQLIVPGENNCLRGGGAAAAVTAVAAADEVNGRVAADGRWCANCGADVSTAMMAAEGACDGGSAERIDTAGAAVAAAADRSLGDSIGRMDDTLKLGSGDANTTPMGPKPAAVVDVDNTGS